MLSLFQLGQFGQRNVAAAGEPSAPELWDSVTIEWEQIDYVAQQLSAVVLDLPWTEITYV